MQLPLLLIEMLFPLILLILLLPFHTLQTKVQGVLSKQNTSSATQVLHESTVLCTQQHSHVCASPSQPKTFAELTGVSPKAAWCCICGFCNISSWWSQGLLGQGCKAEWVSGRSVQCPATGHLTAFEVLDNWNQETAYGNSAVTAQQPTYTLCSRQLGAKMHTSLFPCSLKAAYMIWSRRVLKLVFF